MALLRVREPIFEHVGDHPRRIPRRPRTFASALRPMLEIRRRDFITALGGAAAWPFAARGQQGELMRRIGVLMPFDKKDAVPKARVSAFIQSLAGLGWTDGCNVRMDVRWAGGEINRIRPSVQELVGLQPDIILANGTAPTAALQRETRPRRIGLRSRDACQERTLPQ
jgi:hypothetical protein